MESLNFVVLFTVVVGLWVVQITQVSAFVSLMRRNRLFCLLRREQMYEGMAMGLHCSVPVSVPTKRSCVVRLRGDRRTDSGRGRPLLYLN